jgi:hypothetical protein
VNPRTAMKHKKLLALTLCLFSVGLVSAQGQLQSDSLRTLPQKGSTKGRPKNALRVLPTAKRDAKLLGLAFVRPKVHSGQHAILKLSLSGPAPKHGYSVHLISNRRSPFVLPKKVLIPEGAKSFTLTLRAGVVDSVTAVEVRAKETDRDPLGKAAKIAVHP